VESRLELARRMHGLGTETAFEVVNRVQALEREGRSIVHLHIGAPDFPTPPNVVEAGRKALADGWHRYTPAKGLMQTREAVAEYCKSFHKAEVHPTT
jgi:aspartate/methionine/tyrosine aminotransferase